MDEHLADEHERTMAFAKLAFGQIRALRQPQRRAITKSGTPTSPAIIRSSTSSSTIS
jgi:hypothetical protein